MLQYCFTQYSIIYTLINQPAHVHGHWSTFTDLYHTMPCLRYAEYSRAPGYIIRDRVTLPDADY